APVVGRAAPPAARHGGGAGDGRPVAPGRRRGARRRRAGPPSSPRPGPPPPAPGPRPAAAQAESPAPPGAIQEALDWSAFAAARDGMEARLLDDDGALRPARELLTAVLSRIAPPA